MRPRPAKRHAGDGAAPGAAQARSVVLFDVRPPFRASRCRCRRCVPRSDEAHPAHRKAIAYATARSSSARSRCRTRLYQQQNPRRRHALPHGGIVKRGCGGCGRLPHILALYGDVTVALFAAFRSRVASQEQAENVSNSSALKTVQLIAQGGRHIFQDAELLFEGLGVVCSRSQVLAEPVEPVG